MAPATAHSQIVKRYCSSSYAYTYDDCYSTWNDWGRWVALAVIVVVVLLVAFLFSCFNNRRRRRQGALPMYGTGWIPGSKPPQYGQHNQNYYPNQPYNGGAPAPPYSPPPVGTQHTGTTFNSNEGYYGAHNNIEMQPPQSTYQPQRGGDPVYEAPMGAPPGKGDGVIR